MSLRDWLTDERYDKLLTEVSRYVPDDECAEVLHEVLCQMLEKDTKCDDYASYIVRAAYRSYNSTTSPYARKHAHNVTEVELSGREFDIADEEDELACVDILKLIEECDGVSWYEKEVLKRKQIEGKTFKQLAEEYNLTKDQVIYSYYKAARKIGEKFNI